jgi:DNA-binding transcriptional MerR regulator
LKLGLGQAINKIFLGAMQVSYSIGEVSQTTNIPISTLRYYDREGMFPKLARSNGGIRVFSEKEVATIKVIDCLKNTGMPIKDIKNFLDWGEEGDASLQKRQQLFHERLEEVTKQMAALQETMNTIKYKCWYYDTAMAAGTEAVVKELPLEEIPEEVRAYKL